MANNNLGARDFAFVSNRTQLAATLARNLAEVQQQNLIGDDDPEALAITNEIGEITGIIRSLSASLDDEIKGKKKIDEYQNPFPVFNLFPPAYSNEVGNNNDEVMPALGDQVGNNNDEVMPALGDQVMLEQEPDYPVLPDNLDDIYYVKLLGHRRDLYFCPEFHNDNLFCFNRIRRRCRMMHHPVHILYVRCPYRNCLGDGSCPYYYH